MSFNARLCWFSRNRRKAALSKIVVPPFGRRVSQAWKTIDPMISWPDLGARQIGSQGKEFLHQLG